MQSYTEKNKNNFEKHVRSLLSDNSYFSFVPSLSTIFIYCLRFSCISFLVQCNCDVAFTHCLFCSVIGLNDLDYISTEKSCRKCNCLFIFSAEQRRQHTG